MTPKNILATILILFVVASVAYLIVDGSRQSAGNPGEDAQAVTLTIAVPSPENADDAADVQRRVIAYYFHGTSRCQTCLTIEQYARQALEDGFSEELQAGTLEWHAVNVEEPPNNHFINDYELVTRSVVLVDMEGESQIRWKNLERVWDLVGDREAFISYVQEETRAYLGGR